MFLTEAEAQTKWCPFARPLVTIDNSVGSPIAIGSANRFPDGKVTLCVGSGCMAWRKWAEATAAASATGYCGLAGFAK